MQFNSITICNLFSYNGKNNLNLEGGNNCNITVLMGRNGYGKTSFLNSIKLLFIDSAEEIRRTVQSKSIIGKKQFVLGTKDWWGILNQEAKLNGDTTCYISTTWLDDEGYKVLAKRHWDLSKSHESTLTIMHDVYGSYRGEKAKEYLEKVMPRSFLPFFFFDGEEVQEIAESNSNEITKKMELLLNIRPLENMQNALSELAQSWKIKGQSESAQKELNDVKRKLSSKKDQKSIFSQSLSDIETDIEDYSDQLKKLDRGLRWLRGGVTQEAEIKLKTTISSKEEQRDNILDDLALAWKKDAVLAIHPPLLNKALNKLESLIHSNQGDQEELLETIKQRLESLFLMPPFSNPKLSDKQINFYNKRIVKELDAVGVRECIDGGYDISHDLGKRLFNQLNKYRANSQLTLLKQQTIATQSLWKDIHDANNKLKATGKLSQDKQAEYQKLLKDELETKQKLFKSESKKYNTVKGLNELERSINDIKRDLKTKENAHRVATEFRKQHNFALRLKEALDEVKNRLKTMKRKELESTYNKHLSTLLDSHSLIHKVIIDDDFGISYRDMKGNEIGMSSISAGMKQLSATALLWALKDISGRDFPIIIDTPLGRIDAKHQENLLKKYYPNVGAQVILLPTDSELDKQKAKLLAPYICKTYQLQNPTGRSTTIDSEEV